VERRADRPTRRALALGLPWIPVLGPLGLGLGSRALGQSSPAGSPPEQQPAAQKPSEPKHLRATVILLRHAEKDPSGDAVNPGLSEAGKKRALTLAHLLAHARVTHLFASKYKRARETLQPLAEANGLKIDTDFGAVVADLGPRILDLPAGSVAVVAGHSNTIPALSAALGGEIPNLETTPQGNMIAEKDYGRLFVLTPGSTAPGKNLLLELAYGD
jgi:phosphohistidine phosphatase SixA